MIPWILLDSTPLPDRGGELRLFQRGEEFSIRIAGGGRITGGGGELMNSRVHGSEEALAELACARLVACERPRILIGGLGMGFTLAAALRALGATAEVVVAELLPTAVPWGRWLATHSKMCACAFRWGMSRAACRHNGKPMMRYCWTWTTVRRG